MTVERRLAEVAESHDEEALVSWLEKRYGAADDLEVGIGDDAAVMRCAPGGRLALKIDQVTEGVHFKKGESPERIGYKALARSLSDLAAMGARPRTALIGLSVPRDWSLEDCQKLYLGMEPLLEKFGVSIAGGDINTGSNGLVIGTTVIGEVGQRPILRSGATPGEQIFVTGPLGGSLLGKHLDFEPRVEEGLHLERYYEVGAMMDLSDGLGIDLSRLLRASGVGAEIREEWIPISDAARVVAARDGRSAVAHALGDGEDFELLFTLHPNEALRLESDSERWFPVHRIGTILEELGCWMEHTSGQRVPLEPQGWAHRLGPGR
ncbi:MAG: thiamine-phosphate kinase [Planctomycetota bacterium]